MNEVNKPSFSSSTISNHQIHQCNSNRRHDDRHEPHYYLLPIVLQTSPEVDHFTANLMYSILKSFSPATTFTPPVVAPCFHLIRLSKITQNNNNSSTYHVSLERKMRALTEYV